MTATRPLEDDQPLGVVQSHRVIFNAAAYLHSRPIASYVPAMCIRLRSPPVVVIAAAPLQQNLDTLKKVQAALGGK